jgi:hypothetical protein
MPGGPRMQKCFLVIAAIVIMGLSALPQGVLAEWVEPVPASKTDDEFWHVTYKFDEYLAQKYPNTTAGSDHREPDLEYFQGKLWILFEGPLIPNATNAPEATYKGKLYMRSYSDWNGTVSWGDFIEVTPNAYYADHTNQKGHLIAYKGTLYIFWMSYDRNQKPLGTPEFRFDIMMRTYDGNELGALTPPEIISRQGSFGDWGIDQYPRPIIYQDKLYVVWFREDILKATRDILYRVFDGTTWSDINVLSNYPNKDAINNYPAPSVWNDRLYVMWQRILNNTKYMETVYSYTSNGHTWSPVEPLSRQISISAVTFDTMPNLATYHNPSTGKDELHAFWRTRNSENTQGGVYDYDIVTRKWDGDSWTPTVELSPGGDKGDDTQPYGVDDQQGRLHIFWASKDDSTKDGQDYDIVQVIYDGSSYSVPIIVSRRGDSDEAFMDDAEWWNKGDEMNPVADNYPNQWGEPRIFVAWWSFDYITGCCYNEPEDAHPEIVLRLLLDTDHDKDGVSDRLDACPNDPTDSNDLDNDGVCDNKDWKPMDPNVWKEPVAPSGEGPNGSPLPIYVVLLLLFILGVALMAFQGDKKRPRPRKADHVLTGTSEEE